MSTTLRTWIAGLALAFSALVVTASAEPHSLGGTGLLALLVVFVHAWIVGVTERVCANRGGVEIPRFPLGARLLQTRPSLFLQLLALVGLLALVTQDRTLGLAGLAVVIVLSVDVLRGLLPYAIPVCGLVYALLSMQEFHTLGDLVVTARGWCFSVVSAALWTLVLAGPLLRTDAGGRLTVRGKLVLFLAGLPAYAGGFWLLTRTPLAMLRPDVFGLALLVLAGGVLQSIVAGLLARSAGLAARDPTDVPRVAGHDVGLALLPLALPLLACLALALVPPAQDATRSSPALWAGLFVLLLVVPAIPAAGLVASAFDRLDGRSTGRAGAAFAGGALLLWLLAGPQVLGAWYAPEGLVAALRERFSLLAAAGPILAGTPAEPSFSGRLLGGDLLLLGLPATDLCRAVTLMLAACAALSARLLRHARLELQGPGWGGHVLLLILLALAAWFLVRALGPSGAPLAAALAAGILLVADHLQGVTPVDAPELRELEGLEGTALPGVEEAPEVLSLEPGPSLGPAPDFESSSDEEHASPQGDPSFKISL